LKPEIVTTLDLQLFVQKSTYQVSVAYFNSVQKDVVTLGVNNYPFQARADQYSNLGSLAFQGIEAEGKWLPIQQLVFTGSYTYQTNVDNNGKQNNTAISNTMIKLGAAYTHKYFSIGLFNSYYSQPSRKFEELSILANPSPKAFNLATINVSADINSIFKLKIKPQFAFTGYIQNLLDEKVYYPEFARKKINSIPAMGGRAFYVGITMKI